MSEYPNYNLLVTKKSLEDLFEYKVIKSIESPENINNIEMAKEPYHEFNQEIKPHIDYDQYYNPKQVPLINPSYNSQYHSINSEETQSKKLAATIDDDYEDEDDHMKTDYQKDAYSKQHLIQIDMEEIQHQKQIEQNIFMQQLKQKMILEQVQLLNRNKEEIYIIQKQNNRLIKEQEMRQYNIKEGAKDLKENIIDKKEDEIKTKYNKNGFNNDPIHLKITRNILRNFTFTVWFKTREANSGICGVYDQELGKGGHDRLMYLKGGRPHVRTGKGAAWTSAEDLKLHDDRWHHFAYSCQDNSGQVMYIDGKDVGSNPIDHSDFDCAERVCIGHSADIGSFVGYITDYRWFEQVLSKSKIQQVMINALKTEPIQRWNNQMPNSITISDPKTSNISDKNRFNNDPIHLKITRNILRNFTFTVWFKTREANSGICGVYDQELGKGGHDRLMYLKGGRPHVRTGKGAAWTSTEDLKLHDDRWHHFAYSCQDNSGQVMYIDGKDVGSNPIDHSDFDCAERVCIGHSADIGSFVGYITD